MRISTPVQRFRCCTGGGQGRVEPPTFRFSGRRSAVLSRPSCSFRLVSRDRSDTGESVNEVELRPELRPRPARALRPSCRARPAPLAVHETPTSCQAEIRTTGPAATFRPSTSTFAAESRPLASTGSPTNLQFNMIHRCMAKARSQVGHAPRESSRAATPERRTRVPATLPRGRRPRSYTTASRPVPPAANARRSATMRPPD